MASDQIDRAWWAADSGAQIAGHQVAHVVESLSGWAGSSWPIAVIAGLAMLLTFEHLRVKHQRWSPIRVLRAAALIAVAALAAAVLSPRVGIGQAADLLPDLISDPSDPGFVKELRDGDGQGRLVFTFDGYIHNVGEGPLDVVGNPQIEGGMVQRVRSGDGWREVANPTVRFETDDGHNHFHLIEAVDYLLWDGRTVDPQVLPGSKVGFCLVDSEQVEAGHDQAYSEELDNFCQENNPAATSLRMGISPGWRDIYDRTTTLQWVDISTVAPGRYWIGAITDANDEIVESDEDNNVVVYSTRPAVVPGWSPRDTTVEASAESGTEVTLAAHPYGTVRAPVFVIETGPASGTIDVPVGAALSNPVVTYWPDPGFEGADSVVFSVRDAHSPYPRTAPLARVTIEVGESVNTQVAVQQQETRLNGDGGPGDAAGAGPTLLPDSTFFEMDAGERFSTTVAMSGGTGEAVLYARGLPAGLTIEDDAIAGVAVGPGIYETELIAVDAEGAVGTQPVTMIVNPPSRPLFESPDVSSPAGHGLEVPFGRPRLGDSYEVSGLPLGLELAEHGPLVVGTPTEVGDFAVELTVTNPDGDRTSTEFTWTIRPTFTIAFPL